MIPKTGWEVRGLSQLEPSLPLQTISLNFLHFKSCPWSFSSNLFQLLISSPCTFSSNLLHLLVQHSSQSFSTSSNFHRCNCVGLTCIDVIVKGKIWNLNCKVKNIIFTYHCMLNFSYSINLMYVYISKSTKTNLLIAKPNTNM